MLNHLAPASRPIRGLVAILSLSLLPAVHLCAVAPPPHDPALVTAHDTYDGQPTMCLASDGTPWLSWVAYAAGGDTLMAASMNNGSWSAAQTVTTGERQIVRPALCRTGKSLWVFWTESGDETARVMYATRSRKAWSAPRALTAPGVPAQNQEVVSGRRGDLYVVWQEFREGQYDIMLRAYRRGEWQPTQAVTKDRYDDWDPVVTLGSGGAIWVAWSSFRDGDYDVYLRRMGRNPNSEVRLSSRGEYDLHPWRQTGAVASGPPGTRCGSPGMGSRASPPSPVPT